MSETYQQELSRLHRETGYHFPRGALGLGAALILDRVVPGVGLEILNDGGNVAQIIASIGTAGLAGFGSYHLVRGFTASVDGMWLARFPELDQDNSPRT